MVLSFDSSFCFGLNKEAKKIKGNTNVVVAVAKVVVKWCYYIKSILLKELTSMVCIYIHVYYI